MRGSASSLRSTFSPSLDPPVPIAAEFIVLFTQVIVDFSHPLLPDLGGEPASWFIRWMGVERRATTVIIGGGPLDNQVTISTAVVGANPGDDVVSFGPPPFDVISDTTKQIPAPAFTDFPLS